MQPEPPRERTSAYFNKQASEGKHRFGGAGLTLTIHTVAKLALATSILSRACWPGAGRLTASRKFSMQPEGSCHVDRVTQILDVTSCKHLSWVAGL